MVFNFKRQNKKCFRCVPWCLNTEKFLLLTIGKLSRKLASFLTLFYPSCCWMIRFGVHGCLRNFWWCKGWLFRGRKWVEINGMSQNDLLVLEGKLADLGLVPRLSPVPAAPLWALRVPSEVWVLFSCHAFLGRDSPTAYGCSNPVGSDLRGFQR